MRPKDTFMTMFLGGVLLMICACGGGGGGGGVTGPSVTISFSGVTPGDNAVYMAKNSSLSSGDTLAIDVRANNVSAGVYGAAFDVDFAPSVVTYAGYEKGSFLEGGGNIVNYDVALQSGTTNKLVVGVSRQAGAGGTSGSGTIITLRFKAATSGSIAAGFSRNELRNSSNQAIPGITWSGGTVTVQGL